MPIDERVRLYLEGADVMRDARVIASRAMRCGRHRIRGAEVLDELIAAALFAAVTKAGRWRDGAGASPRTYLQLKMRGAVLDRLEQVAKETTRRAVYRPRDFGGREDAGLSAVDHADAARAVLGKLDERTRRALVLYYYDPGTDRIEDAARRAGLSPGSVYKAFRELKGLYCGS